MTCHTHNHRRQEGHTLEGWAVICRRRHFGLSSAFVGQYILFGRVLKAGIQIELPENCDNSDIE